MLGIRVWSGSRPEVGDEWLVSEAAVRLEAAVRQAVGRDEGADDLVGRTVLALLVLRRRSVVEVWSMLPEVIELLETWAKRELEEK